MKCIIQLSVTLLCICHLVNGIDETTEDLLDFPRLQNGAIDWSKIKPMNIQVDPHHGQRDQNANSDMEISSILREIQNNKAVQDNCGKANSPASGTDSFIVGGEVAKPNEFPWMAYLLYKMPEGLGACGGSLISQEYVLTAAHCVKGFSDFTVYLGAHDLEQNNNSNVQKISATGKFHNDYDVTTIINDIAIIKLGTLAKFNTVVSPICLPFENMTTMDFARETTLLSGWGRGANSAQVTVLRKANFVAMANTLCKVFFGPIIQDSNICVKSPNFEDGGCHGDSGGPLSWIDPASKRYFVIGAASFVKVNEDGSCDPKAPTVFTRVTSFLKWINDNSKPTIGFGVQLTPNFVTVLVMTVVVALVH